MESSDNEDDRLIPFEVYETNDALRGIPPAMETEEDAQSDEEQFDITLAASHSYMGSELQDISGRTVLEPGWRGTVPCMVHRGCVFPGETVPLLLLDREDADTLNDTMKQDRMFALLCPDEHQLILSGFGVLCEVFEATATAPARCKARAVHRCRITKHYPPVGLHNLRHCEVEVLPELAPRDPLGTARLAFLNSRRTGHTRQERSVRALDALVTPWPLFVFDIFDFGRMRDAIKNYYKTLALDHMLPEDPVSLSFWVARNMTLAERDRFALFTVDNALLRLHMECSFISRESVVCCPSCQAELARREHVFAMSSDGVHSTYTNPSGHMHDIVTVTEAQNTMLNGGPSSEYSWFPGYSWSIVMCARCLAHVGWRFDALRRNLRPSSFYGLCRNYAHTHDTPAPDERGDGDGDADAAPDGDMSPDSNDALRLPLYQFRLV